MTDTTPSQNTGLFVTHPVEDQINYRVICGITWASHRGLPVIMTGKAASSFQIPLQTVQITSHNIQEYDSTFPTRVGKNKKLRYEDGKRRRDGMEEAMRSCTGGQQLVWKSMNYCSWYRSKTCQQADNGNMRHKCQFTHPYCLRLLHSAARLGPGGFQVLCFLGPVPTGSSRHICNRISFLCQPSSTYPQDKTIPAGIHR